MNKKSLSIQERREENHKEYEKYLNEKVEITIPLGAEKPGTTTTASCDGKIYEIELGKTVKIPRKVADIIKRSILAEAAVQKKIDTVSSGAVLLGEY